jgi:hypothetical protein
VARRSCGSGVWGQTAAGAVTVYWCCCASRPWVRCPSMCCSMQESAEACCVRVVSGSALPWQYSSSSLFVSAEPGTASCAHATANPVLHQCEVQGPATPGTHRVLGCLRARLAHCHGVHSAVRLKPVGGQMWCCDQARSRWGWWAMALLYDCKARYL